MKGRKMIKTQQPFVPMLIIAFGDHDGFDGAHLKMSESVCKTYITYGFFESTRPHQPFFKGIFVTTAPSTKKYPLSTSTTHDCLQPKALHVLRA